MVVEFRLTASERKPGFVGKLVSAGKSPHKWLGAAGDGGLEIKENAWLGCTWWLLLTCKWMKSWKKKGSVGRQGQCLNFGAADSQRVEQAGCAHSFRAKG